MGVDATGYLTAGGTITGAGNGNYIQCLPPNLQIRGAAPQGWGLFRFILYFLRLASVSLRKLQSNTLFSLRHHRHRKLGRALPALCGSTTRALNSDQKHTRSLLLVDLLMWILPHTGGCACMCQWRVTRPTSGLKTPFRLVARGPLSNSGGPRFFKALKVLVQNVGTPVDLSGFHKYLSQSWAGLGGL